MAKNNQNSQNIKNKKNNFFKRMLKHPFIIFGSIVVLSVGGAITYNIKSGGSVGIDHKLANQKYNTQKKSQKQIFEEHHTDNYPTIETIQTKLKNKFNTNKLIDINYDKLMNAIKNIYGQKVANIASQGELLSQNMTPDQADQAEINIARSDSSNKNYVGYSKYYTTTNLFDNSINTTPVKLQFGPLYSYDDNIGWNNLGSVKISQPFISGTQSDNIVGANNKNLKYYTLFMFVQVKSSMNWKDVVAKMKSLNIKVNNKTVQLAGNNQITYNNNNGIYGKGYGLQLARNTKSDFSKSNQIYTNSIIPICFDVPAPNNNNYSNQSYNVSISGVDTYQLDFEKNSNINLGQ